MSNTNLVTWSLELCSQNASKIDAVNKILIGGASVATSSAASSAIQSAKESVETKTVETEAKSETAATPADITADDFKAAANAARKTHSEEFALVILKDAGYKVGSSLIRSLGKIDEDDYELIISKWAAGPVEADEELEETVAKSQPEEDDGLGDIPEDDDGLGEDEPAEVSAEAVKTALKAFAKSPDGGRDKARSIMEKHGAKALSKVDNCSPKQLSAMFAELA